MNINIDAKNIKTHFATFVDPRSEIYRKHKLLDIIFITIAAVICGAHD